MPALAVTGGIGPKVQPAPALLANSIALLELIQARYRVDPLTAKAGADDGAAQMLPLQTGPLAELQPEPVLVMYLIPPVELSAHAR